jgi:hypothetical protein
MPPLETDRIKSAIESLENLLQSPDASLETNQNLANLIESLKRDLERSIKN